MAVPPQCTHPALTIMDDSCACECHKACNKACRALQTVRFTVSTWVSLLMSADADAAGCITITSATVVNSGRVEGDHEKTHVNTSLVPFSSSLSLLPRPWNKKVETERLLEEDYYFCYERRLHRRRLRAAAISFFFFFFLQSRRNREISHESDSVYGGHTLHTVRLGQTDARSFT